MAPFRLGDTWQTYESDKEAFIEASRALQFRVHDLFEQLRKRTRTNQRTHFARTLEDLFLSAPHLAGNRANY